ncbi:Fic family protein [Mycoplasma marinum]|uniref:Fido domain-containing protein n=1 Tax=Mycoplasma marinum TaxID=1937190 RepID=A0A4R0XQM1_9MOLU|nr:Fic family protein [Mycoplasma marinum]TCG11175.1 hypothetical protein C4B24_02735 [Mycoplasma marinum]
MNNKVILPLASQINIAISDKQISFLLDKLQKISYLEGKIENQGLDIAPNVLAISLLEREGIDSSIIEGTQTNHEEMYYDISEGINDKYSWEVRNLINLYKSSFRDFNDEIMDFTIEDLQALHRDLYKRDIDNFETTYDPIEVIKSVKPGKIIVNDSKPNWIGPVGKGIEQASLILLKPSQKKKYLEDLFELVRSNKGVKSLSTVIIFHPIFESIHPFADGNGRIGRLMLVNLFKYLKLTNYNWIFISDFWKNNKEEYIRELRKVQTTNSWNDWICFFVKSLSETVDMVYNKLNSILDLFIGYSRNNLSQAEKLLLKHFFKYPILNKAKTIAYLKEKNGIANATAYRAFDKITNLLNVSNDGNVYRFKKMIDILSS